MDIGSERPATRERSERVTQYHVRPLTEIRADIAMAGRAFGDDVHQGAG